MEGLSKRGHILPHGTTCRSPKCNLQEWQVCMLVEILGIGDGDGVVGWGRGGGWAARGRRA